MKANQLWIVTMMLLFFAAIACQPADKGAEGEEGTAGDTTAMEEDEAMDDEGMDIERQGVYIMHEIEAWKPWKQEFDDHASAREEAGLELHWIARDDDNPNMIHIAMGAEDMDKARAFASSEDLKSKMEKAGVVGKPTIIFFNIEELNPTEDEDDGGRLLVRHDVADYEAWRPVYDDHAGAREAATVSQVGLARNADDPNHVMIMFDYTDKEKAKKFSSSKDLKSKMEEAGVQGKPKIAFVTVVEWGGDDE